MSSRVKELAKHLTVWAMLDDEQVAHVDGHVAGFVSENKDALEELRSVETKYQEMRERRAQLAQTLVKGLYDHVEGIHDNLKADVKTAGVFSNDVVFWERLSSVNNETYSFLQPMWEELERITVNERLRASGQKRAEITCQRLLEHVKPKQVTNQPKNEGEHHGEKKS